jgi:hypothetical protein
MNYLGRSKQQWWQNPRSVFGIMSLESIRKVKNKYVYVYGSIVQEEQEFVL